MKIRTPILLALVASAALTSRSEGAQGTAPGTPETVEHAARAADFTVGLDYDDARKELAASDPDSALIGLEKARLALYEGDCDGAAAILARPEIAKTEQGETLSDIARGCARATAATVIDKDDAKAVEVRYQDEHDRALTPLIVETVVLARDALTRDLGVTWPKPTRITVVRDLMSLSVMTGLPYEAATTTGTVAVAKWGRVTLLSPRASHHGYSWRDTIAHELTHLAVTRATVDRAPLWLQEGTAKREEIRWRAPGPFDDRPPVDTVVVRGIEMKMDLALDKLGPSIAMLPSADAAMVAFAEVTSFVRFLATTSPPDALPRLFLALRNHKSVDAALVDSTGSDLKAWDVKWRASLASSKKDMSLLDMLGLGNVQTNRRETRDRVRLAELLFGREHPEQALAELDKVPGKDALGDPSLRHLRGRILEALGRTKEAEPLFADPKDVPVSYGGWWALRGRFARDRGDGAVADPSFVEAVAADPFNVEAACESLDPGASPAAPPARLLCDAARKMGEPLLGQD